MKKYFHYTSSEQRKSNVIKGVRSHAVSDLGSHLGAPTLNQPFLGGSGGSGAGSPRRAGWTSRDRQPARLAAREGDRGGLHPSGQYCRPQRASGSIGALQEDRLWYQGSTKPTAKYTNTL